MVPRLRARRAVLQRLVVPTTSDRVYNSERWQRLREQLKRARPVCERCNEDLSEHAHHIVPINQAPALAYEVSNLMAVCRRCHEAIHQTS